MKKYGKILCGTLMVPENYPHSIVINGQKVSNPTEEDLMSAGYLPIEEVEPNEVEGKVAVPAYRINRSKTKIIQSWSYQDIPCIEEHETE